MTTPTPSSVLGISPTATSEEARAAFKRLALRHHPDRPSGSTAMFQLLVWALGEFERVQVCPECEGKGYIYKRWGLASKRENCPKCWKKE